MRIYITVPPSRLLILKIRMKIKIASSKISHKSQIMLGIIRNIVLDLILYFVTDEKRTYKCDLYM